MIKNIEKVIDIIKDEIQTKIDIAVIGLSGGVDSTVCACLCLEALKKKNIYAIHMPYASTDTAIDNKFNNLSKKIANKLEISSKYVPCKTIVDSTHLLLDSTFDAKITNVNLGNIKARSRMMILYSIAHHLESKYNLRVRVINTCNLSESLIGYATKYGDDAGDISLIGDLYKSEVYQLADYFCEKGVIDSYMIDRNPSAGLWENQTDYDEIGYTYDELEPSLRNLIGGSMDMDNKIDAFVREKYSTNLHKLEVSPPKILLREHIDLIS